jgi:hypothetical protein
MRTQPTNLHKAINVLSSVRDNLSYVYLHVRENPLAFQSQCSQHNATGHKKSTQLDPVTEGISQTVCKPSGAMEWTVVHKTKKRQPRR